MKFSFTEEILNGKLYFLCSDRDTLKACRPLPSKIISQLYFLQKINITYTDFPTIFWFAFLPSLVIFIVNHLKVLVRVDQKTLLNFYTPFDFFGLF